MAANRPATDAPETPFADRHIGIDADARGKMLADLGYASAAELLERAVPATIHDHTLNLPDALTEEEALAALGELAAQNRVATSLIGTGWNDCITPPVIRRNMIENPAWYTSYTPYQPEISQGRLEMLLTFQTMVADLTGCEMANASLLDEATAAAEAMTMLRRIGKSDHVGFFVDAECHPQTIAVVQTRAEPLGIEVTVGDPADLVGSGSGADDLFGALVAQPGTTGTLRDLGPIIEAVHDAGALVAVTTDLLACCLITPPGELGADIVVGSAQRFGVPMGFGGPHAAFIACAENRARQLPGRLVGVSVDSAGRPAFRLALQTREQHIRRERATSNICTAQALLANVAAAYGAWHGPEGLTAIARRVAGLASTLADGLVAQGLEDPGPLFDTVTVAVPGRASSLVAEGAGAGINLRLLDGDRVGMSLDETSTPELVGRLLDLFAGAASRPGPDPAAATDRIPEGMGRTSRFMTHPNFHHHRSETEMMRWLRRLGDRDLALDRTMIPLGSCTMKLNAAAEMEPISWPAFADIHPFAPADQVDGYRAPSSRSSRRCWPRSPATPGCRSSPTPGARASTPDLLAIRAWHRDRGEGERDVCLIPASAHGTNAASAVLAGLRVVVVACDERGNIDLADLEARIDEHRDRLAALMITYPSTHGVYEATVGEVCRMIHDAGGQVYTDGANLNALVGVARPGRFGSDVSHLNLHKTFCIPHGGGGPGVGPVAVAEHLAPYLPGHPAVDDRGLSDGLGGGPPVSSAPYGSAGILPISWMYIRMMGAAGLRRATETAVLAANYVAHRLRDHFPVLYTGANGLVAHECIIDLRPLEKASDISNDDVAKRLADYGFHAPTMSFPVPGTLMIEPTESESLRELDRFCDAMIAIRGEIDEVVAGGVAAEDSVLRNAPHTAEVLTADRWDRPYSRERAAYPLGQDPEFDKYFPPVGRIDQAWGDRHLSCSCPPLSAYHEQE